MVNYRVAFAPKAIKSATTRPVPASTPPVTETG
jgi:hypothetical protein